jgi:hypothetical protein
MSRNRKHQTAAVRFGPALKALALCLFVGGSGVGYVWQKDQINLLEDRIKQSEKRYIYLRRLNEQWAGVLATLQSPGEIEARIKRTGLGMVAPQADQIVPLVEVISPPEAATSGGERLYASQPARSTIRQ